MVSPYLNRPLRTLAQAQADRLNPDQVRRLGLEPYAVYGGKVHSFKCDDVPGKVFDADLLPYIISEAIDVVMGERPVRAYADEIEGCPKLWREN